MGERVCSGPLGNIGVGEEVLSNARSPRVSRTWGLLPLIPSGPVLLRVAPPRIVVRHCRLGMGVASTQIPGRNTDTGRSRDKGCLAARMPDVHFLYTFLGGPSPTRNCYLFSAPEDVPGESSNCHPEDPFLRKELCEEE